MAYKSCWTPLYPRQLAITSKYANLRGAHIREIPAHITFKVGDWLPTLVQLENMRFLILHQKTAYAELKSICDLSSLFMGLT